MKFDWKEILFETGKDGVFFVLAALLVGWLAGIVGITAWIAQPMAALALNTVLGLLVAFFLARMVRTYINQ